MILHGTAAANATGGGKKTDGARQAKGGAPGLGGSGGADDEKSTKEAAAARKLREQLDKLKPQVTAAAQTTLQRFCTNTCDSCVQVQQSCMSVCSRALRGSRVYVLRCSNRLHVNFHTELNLCLEEVILGPDLGYLSISSQHHISTWTSIFLKLPTVPYSEEVVTKPTKSHLRTARALA